MTLAQCPPSRPDKYQVVKTHVREQHRWTRPETEVLLAEMRALRGTSYRAACTDTADTLNRQFHDGKDVRSGASVEARLEGTLRYAWWEREDV